MMYNSKFYENRENTLFSAREITDLLFSFYNPESVVDVGCGLGEFLSVFKEKGVKDVLGMDGPWVNQASLKILPGEFITIDLKKPIISERKYDLVISTEVAEHIPEIHSDIFIDSLTGLGDVILFSAAVPFQGGTYHVNEQWPQYWADKFESRNYAAIDAFRSRLWNNTNVRYFYKQNLFVCIKKNILDKYPYLINEYERNNRQVLPLVHPFIYQYYAERFVKAKRIVPKVFRKLFK